MPYISHFSKEKKYTYIFEIHIISNVSIAMSSFLLKYPYLILTLNARQSNMHPLSLNGNFSSFLHFLSVIH